MADRKLILDLCGGTGSWSKPYVDAGYDVRVITLPKWDVRTFLVELLGQPVHGILAAPPCTMFSFARTNARTPRDLKVGMECVRACMNTIWKCMEIQKPTSSKCVPLAWWALENPYHGLLPKFLGKPAFVFNPYDFGDNYKKKTALWGNFTEPVKMSGNGNGLVKFDRLKSHEIHPEQFGKLDRTTRRSITPSGFARAFFKANP